MATLRSPRLRISLETPNEDEYLEIDVQTDNRDLIQWDAVRARKGWPAAKEGPMLWTTFIAWHAAHRVGGPVPDTFDEFRALCVQVIGIDREGQPITSVTAADEADVDPTLPAHEHVLS